MLVNPITAYDIFMTGLLLMVVVLVLPDLVRPVFKRKKGEILRKEDIRSFWIGIIVLVSMICLFLLGVIYMGHMVH